MHFVYCIYSIKYLISAKCELDPVAKPQQAIILVISCLVMSVESPCFACVVCQASIEERVERPLHSKPQLSGLMPGHA